MADNRDPNEKTYPCKTCGRQFIKSSLVKHEPACKKLTKMQRKVFDSGKQRAQNSDIPYVAIKKAAKEKEKLGGIFPRPKTHWRERHEEFIGAVSASKQVEHALKTGAPLPPPPKSSVPSDYVHCDYCGRNFSQNAADRHIPFCKEQNGRRGTSRTRANSTGRIPTTKSLNTAQSSRSNSRGQSPASRYATTASRQQPKTSSGKSPASRRSSTTRQSTGAAAIPPTANGGARASMNTASANSAHQRASALPTPTKRSRSATRTAASRSGSAAKSPRQPTAKPKTPNVKPKSSSSNKPKTPNIKPKSPALNKPKTPNVKPKSPSSNKPKTPKRPTSRSPAKSSIFSSLSSLTGFALGAPISQQTKKRDKSPNAKNGQLKQQQRVKTSGSVKRK